MAPPPGPLSLTGSGRNSVNWRASATMLAEEARAPVSAPAAVTACAAMAFSYVAVLYLPALVLRLPPPASFDAFMIRRFVCAIFSSVASVIATSAILGLRVGNMGNASSVLHVFGIKGNHMWRAVGFPIILTCILYSGSLIPRFLTFTCTRGRNSMHSHGEPNDISIFKSVLERMLKLVGNILAWRNFLVAPITEELVFRACMIPLLLCGGFGKYKIIFLSPIFFSLAHLNHLLELFYQQGYSFIRAFMIVGIQLGYTVIFGWYAAFLFIRTGNFICPVVAHIFCNIMGLPRWSFSQSQVIVGISFAAGIFGFIYLLFPMTEPTLYNDYTDNCSCWQGYCSWG